MGEFNIKPHQCDVYEGAESVTLDPQQFTRWVEVVQYAEVECGGDIAAAMIELVNCGLSHIHPYRPTEGR